MLGGIPRRTSTGRVRREHPAGLLPRSQERAGGRRLSVHLPGPHNGLHNDPGCLNWFLRAQPSRYSGDTPSLEDAAKATPAATRARRRSRREAGTGRPQAGALPPGRVETRAGTGNLRARS